MNLITKYRSDVSVSTECDNISSEDIDLQPIEIDELAKDQQLFETAIQEMTLQEDILAKLPEENKQSETVQVGLQLARRATIAGLGIDPDSDEGKVYIEEITSPVSTEDANKEGLSQKLLKGLKKIFETIMEKIKAFGVWVKKHATIFLKRAFNIIRQNTKFIVGALSAGSDLRLQLINLISTEDNQSSSNAFMVSPYVYDFINNDFIDLYRYFDNRFPILGLVNATRKQSESSPDQPVFFDTFKEWKESIYFPNQPKISTVKDLIGSYSTIGKLTEKERPLTTKILDQINQLEKYSERAEAKFDNWVKTFDQMSKTITELCDDILKSLSQPEHASNKVLIQHRMSVVTLSQTSIKLFNHGMKIIQHQKLFSEKLARNVKSLSR
nr:MAG TPA: hypothetical protein [Caudoviricetes sp.]